MTEIQNNDECIQVIVRIRPNNQNESLSSSLKIIDNNIINLGTKSFNYDYIANENSTQNEIFEVCAKKICDSSLEGYNGTIFAYGQTGTGKTYTLFGNKYSINSNNSIQHNNQSENYDIELGNNNENNINENFDLNDESLGLLPRIIYYMFNNKKVTESKYTFKISFLEIYQEQIHDLLNPDQNKNLQIRDVGNNIFVENLRTFIFSSPEEGLKYLIQGAKLRHSAQTKMNEGSSRSHAIISIYIENIITEFNNKLKNKKSVFHIIDLAGSERQNKTGAIGERVKEAGSINKSLLNLSIVIKNIINNIKPIPYRDSKLTHILKDSLGGNSKTTIIANISNSDNNSSETLSTLYFAQNAKKVKNKAIINEEFLYSDVNYIKEEIKRLTDKYNKIYDENVKLKSQMSKSFIVTRQNSLNDGVSKLMDDVEKKDLLVKSLMSENDLLKDKIQKLELTLKIKEKDNSELNLKIQENKILVNSNNEQIKNYIMNNAFLTEANNNLTIQIEDTKNRFNSQIDYLTQQKNDILNSKNNIIDNLNKDLEIYMERLSKKEQEVIEKNNIIEDKNKFIDQMKNEKDNYMKKEKILNEQINLLQEESKKKDFMLNDKSKTLDEIKLKGKTVIEKYDLEIEKKSKKIKKLEEDKSSYQQIINDLKILISSLENSKIDLNEDLKNKQSQIKSYLNSIIILDEQKRNYENEIKKLKEDNIRLREENEIANSFKGNNISSKNNLIAKIKMDYNKLKEDFLKLKSVNEDLQKNFLNKKNIDINEILSKLKKNTSELNEARHTIHLHINKIKDILKESDYDNYSDNINLISAKTIEDKLYFYFEKLNGYIQNLKLEAKNTKEELEKKEKDINILRRKKNIYDNINNIESNEQNTINYKGRNTDFINSLIKTDLRKTIKKRKMNDTQIFCLNETNSKNLNDNKNNIELNTNKNNNKDKIMGYSNLDTGNSTVNENINFPKSSNKENITSMFHL